MLKAQEYSCQNQPWKSGIVRAFFPDFHGHIISLQKEKRELPKLRIYVVAIIIVTIIIIIITIWIIIIDWIISIIIIIIVILLIIIIKIVRLIVGIGIIIIITTIIIIRSNFGSKTVYLRVFRPHHSAIQPHNMDCGTSWQHGKRRCGKWNDRGTSWQHGGGAWSSEWSDWSGAWIGGWSRECGSRWAGEWVDTSGWHGSCSSSQVAESAAGWNDEQLWSDAPRIFNMFDNQNIQDMEQEEQEEAKHPSRRVEKLGKAFQNYSRGRSPEQPAAASPKTSEAASIVACPQRRAGRHRMQQQHQHYHQKQ